MFVCVYVSVATPHRLHSGQFLLIDTQTLCPPPFSLILLYSKAKNIQIPFHKTLPKTIWSTIP